MNSLRSIFTSRYSGSRAKQGQTLLLLCLVVVMLGFAALFYFDVNKILHIKGITRNGGDAAALAAAKWQGISLNLIGSMNAAQASAVLTALESNQTWSANSELISDLQRRITFSGPLHGYVSAQQMAKRNGLHNNDVLGNGLRNLTRITRDEYDYFYSQPFSPSNGFTTCWQEVADMYQLILDQGLAVEATVQSRVTYSDYGHLLLNPSFYDAIADRNWCWIYWNARIELYSYSDWGDWMDLPEIEVSPPQNPEVLSLHLSRVWVRGRVPELPPSLEWEDLMDDLQDELDALDNVTYLSVNVDWAYYSRSRWNSWSEFIDETYDGAFPWDRDIRAEYDYTGADAAMTVRAKMDGLSGFGGRDELARYPAAKPFGYLEDGATQVPPHQFGIVLPAYDEVRLIPRGASHSGSIVPRRSGWIYFISRILPDYMENGPEALTRNRRARNNFYSRQLQEWEELSFRQDGIEWLEENSDQCVTNTGSGGSSSGGGTQFGY